MRIEVYYKLTCITSLRLDFHIYSIIAITLRLIQGFFKWFLYHLTIAVVAYNFHINSKH